MKYRWKKGDIASVSQGANLYESIKTSNERPFGRLVDGDVVVVVDHIGGQMEATPREVYAWPYTKVISREGVGWVMSEVLREAK